MFSPSITTPKEAAPARPSLRASWHPISGRARRVGLPRRNNSTGRSGETWYFHAGRFAMAAGRPSPTCTAFSECLRRRKPGSAGSRPTSPRPSVWPYAADVGCPPRFLLSTTPGSTCRSRPTCRERRGPSAGDGLGNRGAIRAHVLCTDREHGGTQAVSHRPGSPREARREGPNVLLFPLAELFRARVPCEGPKMLFQQNQNPKGFPTKDAVPSGGNTPVIWKR